MASVLLGIRPQVPSVADPSVHQVSVFVKIRFLPFGVCAARVHIAAAPLAALGTLVLMM
jgi:hypothetical protein